MNTIRNFFPNEIENLKVILRSVYKTIYKYQNERTESNEIQIRKEDRP
ncbi:hypothetical protein FHS15_001929 [Paenibacillus castaneae]|nr:hypothetical protein [Paenibacillus castaneae]